MSLRCLQSSVDSIRPMVWEEMSFEEFLDGHHGGHLGYLNGRILAILNLCVNVMLPIKFWLNPTYCLGDVIWRISRWRPWRPTWTSERYNFSNSESLCCSNASHQVLPQSMAAILDMGTERFLQFWVSIILQSLPSSFSSILLFGIRCCLKNFKMAGGHLGYLNRMILAIFYLCVTVMPPIKFWLNLTFGLGADVVWRISRWPPWQPSWISKQNNLNNSDSLCHSDASHKVLAQSDLWFWRRYRLKNFKMAAVAAILDIGTEQFLQFWISVSLWCFPLSFGSIQLTVWEEMSFEEFQDGCHRYRKGTILAILNLYVTSMPPIVSMQSDVWFLRRYRLKNFKMATVAAIFGIWTEQF